MPLIYPGFGWDNLMNKSPGTTYKSRLEGKFMWQQFLDAKQLGAKAGILSKINGNFKKKVAKNLHSVNQFHNIALWNWT